MTQEAQLKSCPNPWCEHEFGPKVCRRIAATGYFVSCDDCGMDGPTMPTEDQAIERWNTRIESGVVAELVEAGKRLQAHNLCGDFTVSTGECAIAFGAFQEALAKLENTHD